MYCISYLMDTIIFCICMFLKLKNDPVIMFNRLHKVNYHTPTLILCAYFVCVRMITWTSIIGTFTVHIGIPIHNH